MIGLAVSQSNKNVAWLVWNTCFSKPKAWFLNISCIFSIFEKIHINVNFFKLCLNYKKLEDISRLMVFIWSKSVQWFQRYSLLNLGVFFSPHLQRTFVKKTICNTKDIRLPNFRPLRTRSPWPRSWRSNKTILLIGHFASNSQRFISDLSSRTRDCTVLHSAADARCRPTSAPVKSALNASDPTNGRSVEADIPRGRSMNSTRRSTPNRSATRRWRAISFPVTCHRARTACRWRAAIRRCIWACCNVKKTTYKMDNLRHYIIHEYNSYFTVFCEQSERALNAREYQSQTSFSPLLSGVSDMSFNTGATGGHAMD